MEAWLYTVTLSAVSLVGRAVMKTLEVTAYTDAHATDI